MKAWVLVWLLAPAAAGTSLSFQVPFQLDGDVQGTGAWALLVFAPGDDATFHVEASGDDVVHHRVVGLQVRNDEPSISAPYRQPLPTRSTSSGYFSADLGVGHRWASVFIQADRLWLGLEGAATGETALEGQAVDPFMRASALWSYRLDRSVPAGPVLSWRDVNASFHLEAEGLHVVEYHEAAVDCRAGQCPPDGRGMYPGLEGNTSAGVESRAYYEVRTSAGTVAAAGRPQSVAFGGAGTTLDIQGSVRLPQARHTEPCQCPALEGTVRLEGHVRLEALQGEGDRIQAQVSGNFTGARLDETSIDAAVVGGWRPTPAVAAAASVVVAWTLLAWLLQFRIRKPKDAMRNHVRRRILQHVADYPGTTVGSLATATSHAKSTTQHHVAILERVGLVTIHQRGNTRHIYENHGKYGPADQRALAASQNPRVQALDLWLLRKHRATQKEVIEHAATLGITRSTTQNCLWRLVAAGRARTWRERGLRWYETNE